MHCNCKTDLGTVLPKKPTLVTYPMSKSFAWTISLAPSMKIKRSDCRPTHKNPGKEFLRWHELDLFQQWAYYQIYVADVFKTFGILQYHGYPEINEAGELHCHCVCASTNVEWDVAQCWKLCKVHDRIRRLVGKKKQWMRLNFIHPIKDPRWIQYIQKKKGYDMLQCIESEMGKFYSKV